MDIGHILQNLDARLARMERSPRLSHAALDNTSIVVKDGTGAVRGAIGMQPDGTIGLVAQDGPAPGAPTAPVVTPSIGGLRVVWDGALADGSPLPADFDHVAVHVSTSTGFTPSAATFVGTITRSGDGGMLPVTPLPYEPHYTVLIAVNSSGIGGPASTETAATPLQVDGPDLTVGSVTAAAIQAGAITAEKLEAILQIVTRIVAGDSDGARVELNEDGLRVYNTTDDLVIRFDAADGSAVFTGDITGSDITGSTVTGGLIQTSATGERIALNEDNNNKIILYDEDGTPTGSFTPGGIGLASPSTGNIMAISPSTSVPSIRWTTSAEAKFARILSGTTATDDLYLQLLSSRFTEGAITDWVWNQVLTNDHARIERIREDGTGTTLVGGRLLLNASLASIAFRNTADTTQEAFLNVEANLAYINGGRFQVLAPASANSALYVQALTAHTGNLIRAYRDTDKFLVDKDGNTTAAGILAAGNIAFGRINITPSAANTPTSGAVTGLNLKGTTFRAIATASTTVPGTAVTGVGCTGVSSTGMNVWVTRTNTTLTGIDWMIIGE